MWEMVRRVQEMYVKEGTANGHRTGRKTFEKFCKVVGVADPFSTPDDLCAAFCVYGTIVKKWKVSTIKQYLHGVRAKHLDLGLKWVPLKERVPVYRALKGLDRIFGKHVTQKQAMTPELLLSFWSVTDFTDVNMLTLWAAMLVALFRCLGCYVRTLFLWEKRRHSIRTGTSLEGISLRTQ